jgi:NADH oxidase (H2O2-forming)
MKDTGSAVIVGGGVIGLEMACACIANGIKTTVVEMLPYILPLMLDEDMASMVHTWMEKTGIEILTSTRVSSIDGNERVEAVVLDEKTIEADMVVFATGIRPNNDLAQRTGLDLGKTGGIAVNSLMKAARQGRTLDNVYALGDCVEVASGLTNQPYISAFASTASLQARVVADNICGDRSELEGYLSPAVTVVADLQIGSVGLTSHSAKQAGIDPTVGRAEGFTRSGYYPGKKKIHIKLLVHNDRLIGTQMISEEDVKERINYVTLAIKNNMSVHDLKNSERCFTPPLSLMVDPFIRALESID